MREYKTLVEPVIRFSPHFQALTLLPAGLAWGATPLPIEFNRDIRPILSENCFQCHGQDAERREAKLRLDDPASATRDRDGYAAIVPGQPGKSELILRITSTDEDEMMPPRDSNKHLTMIVACRSCTCTGWSTHGEVVKAILA